MTGETPSISEYLDFCSYYWINYRINAVLGELGIIQWIGVSHNIGHNTLYCIMNVTVRVIQCVTSQRLTNDEIKAYEFKKKMGDFEFSANKRFENAGTNLSSE